MKHVTKGIFRQIDVILTESPGIHLQSLTNSLRMDRHDIESTVRRCTGMSYRRFQQQKVLEKAKLLLSQQDPIKVIALELNYRYPQDFSRFIRHMTGRTASELRTILLQHSE